MKSVNHRNKTGRLRLDAVPHFWDWIKGNSSFGSTANISFKVDVNILSLKKKKSEKKWEQGVGDGCSSEEHRKKPVRYICLCLQCSVLDPVTALVSVY